jgi:hypothetical protein
MTFTIYIFYPFTFYPRARAYMMKHMSDMFDMHAHALLLSSRQRKSVPICPELAVLCGWQMYNVDRLKRAR